MKEYKVLKSKQQNAELLMNEMARQGWEVVTVTYWTYWTTCLLITFSRETVQQKY